MEAVQLEQVGSAETQSKREEKTSTKSGALGMDMKAMLSTLWVFVLFNVVFRDIHELFRPGFLEEIMTGTVDGVQLTEEQMLVAGILMEIPIVMVVLSRVLPYGANRWANIIGGGVGILFVITNKVHDLDDVFFFGVVVVTALVIIWQAWRWSSPEPSPNDGG